MKNGIVLLVFLGIFLLSSLRFDVGPDYSSYASAFNNINSSQMTLGWDYSLFSFLSKLFSFSSEGYIFVLSFYSFGFLLFIFKAIKNYSDNFLWSIFILITMGFLLDSFDRVRQAAAVAIFIYSLKYIEGDKLFRFSLFILIASLFHISAILCFPIFFIKKINFKLNLKIMLSIIVALYAIVQVIDISSVWRVIYSITPMYSSVYNDTDYSSTGGFNSGLGNLFLLFICSLCLIKEKKELFRNLIFIGIIINIISLGNLNIMRISDYFLTLAIISFPTLMVSFNSKIGYLLKTILLILIVIFFEKNIQRNHFEYKTIFSESFDSQSFENRSYR